MISRLYDRILTFEVSMMFDLFAVVTCPSLSAPAKGHMSGSGLTYQSQRTFSCSTGYNLGGSTSRTCQADGSWSGTTATCSSKWGCPLSKESEGETAHLSRKKTFFGAVI